MDYSMFVPAQQARKSLAEKLGLAFSEEMQDWEYEVSDYRRLPDFMVEYDKQSTSDKEKESLMEIMLDSLNDLSEESESREYSKYFTKVLDRLRDFSKLHVATLSYWTKNKFRISEQLRVAMFGTAD